MTTPSPSDDLKVEEISFFNNISKFVEDLSTNYNYKPLKHYNTIVKNTKTDNKAGMRKHINIFRNYVNAHSNSIKSRNFNNLKKIVYPAEKMEISIDIKGILMKLSREESSQEEYDIIWKHMENFLYLSNPIVNKELVMNEKNEKEDKKIIDDNDPNSEFVNDTLNTIQAHLSPEQMADPGTAVMSLFSSGALSGLISSASNKANSGKMNTKSLIKTAKNLLASLEEEDGSED
jgi:hypothetical protein